MSSDEAAVELAGRIERGLGESLLALTRQVADTSSSAGVPLFLVGGTVRDILLGSEPTDLDLVAVGPPAGFAELVARDMGGSVKVASQFGTHKLSVGGVEIDLAAARRESYRHPGALPHVQAGSIDEDLARRDFSINAMAVPVQPAGFGALMDPFGGRDDLRSGAVKVLHPGSLAADPTRMLRAIRYGGRLGFELDPDTERLLSRDLRYLDDVGGDRLRHEFERILVEPRAMAILLKGQELGVLAAVHPALSVRPDLLGQMDAAGEADSPIDLVLLAAIAYGARASDVSGLVRRLNMGSRWARVVLDAATVRDATERLQAPVLRRAELFSVLRGLDIASVEGAALATDNDRVRQRIELFLRDLRHLTLLLNGDDLMAIGVPQGPRVGQLLEELLLARVEGLLSTRQDEESLVRRSLCSSA